MTKELPEDSITVALAGNPNVGKSTIFNALTGLNQHTGNWAGKTVSNAKGKCQSERFKYTLVDIPGTYSLLAHSPEEEVARDFLCFEKPQAVIVVCDATRLERNLNLVLQTMEICKNVIVCVNLLDEAKHQNIKIDLEKLSEILGVKVVGTVGHKPKSITALLKALDDTIQNPNKSYYKLDYPEDIEKTLNILIPKIDKVVPYDINPRWLALKLLEPDFSPTKELVNCLGKDFLESEKIEKATADAKRFLCNDIENSVAVTLVNKAEKIANIVVNKTEAKHNLDRKLDNIFTSKAFGYPIMLLLLGLIFWITISGANYPSDLLSNLFNYLGSKFNALLNLLNTPTWLCSLLTDGIYKTVTWVVSVMLPPMAIFFPLFTLLEDSGYLPRIAFNLDKPFKKCNACGKQALTMCMGFGCNAVGVTGCRIIDSKRERLLAILTNCLVPCNGRFPAIVVIITMFLCIGTGVISNVFSALILTDVILLGIISTFLMTKLLSKTLLKGMPSSYTLELPSYRKPQFAKVIVHSVFDRTLFVLGRSVAVAAPAGLLIWLMANISIGNVSILQHCADFLDPFAFLLGLDGVILLAFILGLPANEIVIPIIIMSYMNNGTLTELTNISDMHSLFIANGWTITTAISFIIFSLLHWPCATTILTIKKETGSIKWTVIAVLLPTVLSCSVCMLFNFVISIF